MKQSYKWLLGLVLLAFLTVGLTLEKVFSVNSVAPESKGGMRLLEQHLLLSDLSGLMPDAESRKVIRKLDAFVAQAQEVRRNEWLEKIAQDYGVPSFALRSTNNLDDPVVRPNQVIIVQNKKGMVHIAKEGEALDGIIQTYEKLGSTKDKILAVNAWDEMTYLKEGELYLKEGSVLWIPDARRSFPVFSRPVAWSRISSRFGFRRHPVLKTKRYHDGFDMVAPHGAPVFSGDAGVITFAGWQGGYGNLIEIRHNKTTTRYGHLSQILVQVGQKVKRKQLVGRVGSTGLSTGPHLHFEVRRNSDGKVQNPRKYLF